MGDTDELCCCYSPDDGGRKLVIDYELRLPMVEIFETIEGEGTRAGFPTVFVRLFGCNLRCSWCDTVYSYPPYEAETTMNIREITEQVSKYRSTHVCVTGGEPLLYGDKSSALINAIAQLPQIQDIHIETNGAIALDLFLAHIPSSKVRYVMDVKLPDSSESVRMHMANLALLRKQDEVKFVIASEADFRYAVHILEKYPTVALPLFSPVWGSLEPTKLVELMLAEGLSHVKLNMQLHKIIWDPAQRGV